MNRSKRTEEEKQSLSQSNFSEPDKEEDEEEGSEGSDEDDENMVIQPKDLIFYTESNQRQWLKKHGKEKCISFDDEQLKKLRNYFLSLDEDGSGSIGVDELEDPLIALGLVENRQQVQDIVTAVDDDGSQQIEFPEFLNIIKGSNSKDGKDSGTGAIY